MDSPPEKSFNDIAEAAANACNTPIALVSFLDKDRQWFKAKIGLDLQETLRVNSFCQYCIQSSGAILEIPDTTQNETFHQNPFVTQHPHLRFYAGAPIKVNGGHCLGSVCVMDQAPGQLSTYQRRILEILASQVSNNLELRLSRINIARVRDQEISRRVAESEMEERRRIGQELHDGVAQTLAAANMKANYIKEQDCSKEEGELAHDHLKELLGQAEQEIRGVGHSLMGKKVREEGLQQALESLSSYYDPLEQISAIKCSLCFEDAAIDDTEALNFYRIAQEFIQNSIKHSQADSIWIKGGGSADRVWMTLEDDGKGLDKDQLTEFGGMRNMDNRMRSMGGRCHIKSKPDDGLRLIVVLKAS